MIKKTNSLDTLPAITGRDEDSFARFTINNRLPQVIDNIIVENQYSGEIKSNLQQLRNNLLFGKIEFVSQSGQMAADWSDWLLPFIGKRWTELPFYFAEAYFYQLILELTHFFQTGTDPFFVAKVKDIHSNVKQFSLILANLKLYYLGEVKSSSRLNYLLNLSLWGNKSDLSQLNLDTDRGSELLESFTVLNHAESVCNHLLDRSDRVDIVLDNSGLELFTDLILAEQLISQGVAKTVVLHAKKAPTFVSDATIADINYLCYFLGKEPDQNLITFVKGIELYMQSGAITIRDDAFWNTPLHFYDMPTELYSELQKSDLIIFKGDANYRRVFGDKELPVHFKMEDMTQYLPSSALAIRIFKSEIVAGLDPGRVSSMRTIDQQWLTNGKYGIIQMVKR